jgi:hypothetical protein
VREAYRISAVILLGQGRTVADVADALLFDPDTVPGYFKRYWSHYWSHGVTGATLEPWSHGVLYLAFLAQEMTRLTCA